MIIGLLGRKLIHDKVNSRRKQCLKKWRPWKKNEAWNLVELYAGRKHIGSKLVFKKMFIANCKLEKYKSNLVANIYSYVEGIAF